MGIEQMHPGKPLLFTLAAALLGNPSDSGFDYLLGGSFHEEKLQLVMGSVLIVVDIKSLVQSKPGIQGERADKGTGAVSDLF